MLSVTLSFGNPLLTANPMESLVDYYVLSIDGEEFSVSPEFDMTFIHDLEDIADGKHTLEIICGNNELGEGPGVKFFLEKKTTHKWIFYTIKKDPSQTLEYYDQRFDEPLKVKIKNNDDINEPPKSSKRWKHKKHKRWLINGCS
jgi:hypothetical protein